MAERPERDQSPALDERFMREALRLAERGLSEGEMPVGAVAVLDEAIISSGYWRFSRDALLDHAEMLALRRAEKDVRILGRRPDVTLYTTLEPCLLCMGAAMSFMLGRIVFALEAAYDGASNVTKVWQPALGFPPEGFRLFSNPDVVGGVCREEALALMRAYVERNPDNPKLEVMLPGFSYPPWASEVDPRSTITPSS
jgi:tRNA(adenine34) deaminase